jgi:hypothetical protein
MHRLSSAPDWHIERWFNSPSPLSLAGLRGKIVLAIAFQMLCPGCVSRGLPQALRARDLFAERDLAVIGLHTVFEHHEAQGTPEALTAFLHEYRIGFPVGLDATDPSSRLPKTMRAYRMQGTPTTLLIDRHGCLRLHEFGHLDDMRLGAAIASLLAEATQAIVAPSGIHAGAEAECCPLGDDQCR